MRPPGGIEAFVLAAVDQLGGAAERVAEGLYTILVPAQEGGEPEMSRLAFDPDALEDDPEAEMVTLGSPTLERLLQRVADRGRVAEAFLALPAGSLRGARDRLARSFQFADAAWAPAEGCPQWVPAGVFLFRARYLSDSQEEELAEVALNLTDGRLLRRLEEAIEKHGMAPEPWEAWPTAEELPLSETWAVVRAELERRLVASLGRRRRALEGRLRRESGRAAGYYEEFIRELQEQSAALPADDPRRAALASKVRAVAAEREGRLAELAAKYRLEVEVALLSVLRLYLPRLVVSGRLTAKSQAADLPLVWDPVEQAWEPARCRRCGTFTYALGLDRSGSPACPTCLQTPARPPAPARR
jgi:hypothetical protein